jgi:hypothetical protein
MMMDWDKLARARSRVEDQIPPILSLHRSPARLCVSWLALFPPCQTCPAGQATLMLVSLIVSGAGHGQTHKGFPGGRRG